jgi:hypothetical protein
MKRRALDFFFSVGGVGIAVLLLVLGLVLTSNANFANSYVTDQLTDQAIMFPPAEALSEEEQARACVVANAGQMVTTGKQAECYANDFIGLHLESTADGMTYAQLGTPERELRGQVAEAEASGDPALASLQEELAEVSAQRDSLFRGETLRGVLLTSYGFSEFGVKADQAAAVAYAAAALMVVLSIGGFVHAARTKEDVLVAPVPALETIEQPERDLAGV